MTTYPAADASLSPAQALDILQALKPKQASTYHAATVTVTAWRKEYKRRANGTIIGYNDGVQGQWRDYPLNVVEAARRVLTREHARQSSVVEAQQSDSRRLAVLDAKLTDLRGGLTELVALGSEAVPYFATCKSAIEADIERVERDVAKVHEAATERRSTWGQGQ